MLWKNAFSAMALFGVIAFPTVYAADPADGPDEEVPYAKLDEGCKNLVKLETALKLKDIGWGEDVKGGQIKNYSLESLLSAARMLREMPKMEAIDPKSIETIPAKEPATTEGKAPPAFSIEGEAKAILERSKEILNVRQQCNAQWSIKNGYYFINQKAAYNFEAYP